MNRYECSACGTVGTMFPHMGTDYCASCYPPTRPVSEPWSPFEERDGETVRRGGKLMDRERAVRMRGEKDD